MKEDITLSVKDVIVGVSGNIHVLLNYCILVGKSLINHCRNNNTKPIISSFKVLLAKKYHVELYIAGKNKKLNDFHKKWRFMLLTWCFSYPTSSVAKAFVVQIMLQAL